MIFHSKRIVKIENTPIRNRAELGCPLFTDKPVFDLKGEHARYKPEGVFSIQVNISRVESLVTNRWSVAGD